MRGGVSLQTRREFLQHMIARYRKASSVKKKSKLLDAFTAATGYNRKYAMELLNHAQEGQPLPQRPHSRQYGSDVQHALFLVWNAANRICPKRLIPFLPTLLEALERHEHLQITEECRKQLLSMSAATADRRLASRRKLGRRSISTTRAGTLLKQQIPIRTFQEWNETRPGFLEADLVAHCGTDIEGGYLYTLTLTDIATGWTECLPLLLRSQETVLAAIQRARTLFPFPILGIDTDNGGEFINETLTAYCEQEHLTFTRGRPYLKNDQCFVEQKNGAIVRQVVGYDRLVGEHTYRQLTELYRALRLYVNCCRALDETPVETALREESALRLRPSQDSPPTLAPVGGLACPEAARAARGGPRARSHSLVSTTRAVATGRLPLCHELLSICSKPIICTTPRLFCGA